MRLFLPLVLGLSLACAGIDAPVEPPVEVEPVAEPAAELAFDGLYAGEDDGSRSYLRFYEDGHVTNVGSTGSPEKVANWLGRTGEGYSQGTYELDGNALSFSATSSVGTVDFSGTLEGDVLRLHWHSHINDAEGDDVFSFVPLTFGAE